MKRVTYKTDGVVHKHVELTMGEQYDLMKRNNELLASQSAVVASQSVVEYNDLIDAEIRALEKLVNIDELLAHESEFGRLVFD